MIDRTAKRDRRDGARRKSYPQHGKSLIHILNAQRKRGVAAKDRIRIAGAQ